MEDTLKANVFLAWFLFAVLLVVVPEQILGGSEMPACSCESLQFDQE